MNIVQNLNLIPATIVLILGIILFSKLRQNRQNIFLALSCIFFSLSIAGLMAYWLDSFRLNWLVDILFLTGTLASSAAFYIYVADLTRIEGHKFRDHLIWLPAIFFLIANGICYSMMNFDGRDYLYQANVMCELQEGAPEVYFYKRIFDSHLWRPVVFLQTTGVVIYTFRRVHKYRQILDEYYSSVGQYIPQRFALLKTGLVLLTAVMGVYMSQRFSSSKIYVYSTAAAGLVMTVLFLIVFCFATQSRYTVGQLREMIAESAKRQIPETNTQSGKIRERVNEQIEARFFLDPEINLITFSENLNSNRTYVSNFIHDEYNCSFSDFVNNFRVEYAIKLMDELPETELTVKRLMLDSGFNSIQSFNRNFKKFKGHAPTEWMENFLHRFSES